MAVRTTRSSPPSNDVDLHLRGWSKNGTSVRPPPYHTNQGECVGSIPPAASRVRPQHDATTLACSLTLFRADVDRR
jgi:hypothetical protein